MPNYIYKCTTCETQDKLFLPISSDPNEPINCKNCDGKMTRRVGSIAPTAHNGLKTFAGDWFKKTYGHELGEDGISQQQKRMELEKALREHKKENGE